MMCDNPGFDELLIMCVEKHPNVYNKKLKEFKDTLMKENSWLAIAEHLNSDAETVKRRWDNLRDRFVRAHTDSLKLAPSGSGADVISTKSTFPFFKLLLWLVPHIRKRRLISATPRVSQAQVHTEEHIVDAEDSEIFSSQSSPSVDIEEGWYDVNDSGLLSPTSSEPRTTTTTPKATKNKSIPETLTKAVESFTSFVNARKKGIESDASHNSSDMNFMRSVVVDMEHIPQAKKLKFKREVLELLEKYTSEV
ncbi:uncharacterized protein LOC116159655 [Photinus pyralis]|uniref:uncharacterized protein LOC116159655 n=1 Tax=Photinus pyralis TaxID=7054 RepID=UPI0012670365|nr:uncharacterized protein LOC116159655 [Photinus pyralis]